MARYEPGAFGFDVRQGAEFVLQLEHVLRAVERFAEPDQLGEGQMGKGNLNLL